MNVHGWTKTHGVWGVVGQRMRQACREALPDDSHEKARGRLVVAVHRVKPLQLRPSMIDRFHSRDDLVEACYCSSFIPLFLEPSLSAKWRGERWIDGGFVDMLPPVPPHIEGSQKIIKSLPFELLARMRSDRDDIITFPKDSTYDWSIFKLALWAVHPPDDDAIMHDLLQAGEDSADAWLANRNSKNGV